MSFINWGSESADQRKARQRYEEELALFEQAVRFSRMIGSLSGAPGSGKKVDASANQYVENGYIDNYFE